MDFYDTPSVCALNRYEWFDLPRENGSFVKVIAVSAGEAVYWIIAYAILVALLFTAVSRLIVDLVLTFLPIEGSGNRMIMLVAFYNANNPTTAILLMLEYCRRALFYATVGHKHAVDWSTLRCALALMATAIALIGATTTAQFLVSGQRLTERKACRVYPFIPDFRVWRENSQLPDEFKPIRASAGFMALGRFETSRNQLVDKVHVDIEELPRDAGRRMLRLNYNYQVTGYEMGLQNAAILKQRVSGWCKTEYNTQSIGEREYWYLGQYALDEYNPIDEQLMPPFINYKILPNQTNASMIKDDFIFSLTPHTEFRLSLTENLDDPWYATEFNPDYNESDRQGRYAHGGKLRVKRGRPALMCVQRDNYTLDGYSQTVHNVKNLTQLHGLKLSSLLRDEVFPKEFDRPVIAKLARSLSFSGLASSIYFDAVQRMLWADKASLEEDFTKLVSVAFLYSREVARNTVLLYPRFKGKGLENVSIVNDAAAVPNEYSDIIIESSDVAALSVTVLVTIPIMCVFAWVLVITRRFLIQPKATSVSDNSGSARLNLHTIGLHATQLYRCLDEVVSEQRKWSGRLSMAPYIKEMGEGRFSDQNPSERELFIVPKLVKLEAGAGFHTGDDVKKNPAGSEKLGTETGGVVRVDSDGRALDGDESYDIVLTIQGPQTSQPNVG